ncbi:hypothetical protein LCGC14_2646570 [marine sediment metagenome]|uniref:Uncharacterized protein n=1 Tax=marine sediment metagenome TaxID=412755 RepID=A0A0F8ZW23_9ZZZZ
MAVTETPLEAVRSWNNFYSKGQRVEVTRDLGEKEFRKTKSEAFVAESGHAVIFLEGILGYYLLERVKEGYPKAKAEDVKESIIIDYCSDCVSFPDDYDCPDHECPAWKAISILCDIAAREAVREPV